VKSEMNEICGDADLHGVIIHCCYRSGGVGGGGQIAIAVAIAVAADIAETNLLGGRKGD